MARQNHRNRIRRTRSGLPEARVWRTASGRLVHRRQLKGEPENTRRLGLTCAAPRRVRLQSA